MEIASIAVREEAVPAFQAVEGEREYQNTKWSPDATISGGRHGVGDWTIYIEDYLNEAKRAMSRQPEPQATEFALHTMRKIAAMAIACMEQNGVRTRGQEGPRPVGFAQS